MIDLLGQPDGDLDGSGSPVWPAATVILGASLWAQLFWYTVSAELRSGQPGLGFLLLYVAPLAATAVAGFVRHSALAMFVAPLSFLPGLVLLPEQDAQVLMQPKSLLFLGTTLTLYLGASALSVDRKGPFEFRASSTEAEGLERVRGVYPNYLAGRLAVLLVIFAALTWAVFADPSVTASLNEAHGDAAATARVFIAVSIFFVWAVVAFTFFFVPLSNLEYDVRAMSREIDGMADDTSVHRRRLLVYLAVAAGGVVGLGMYGF